MRDMRRVGAFVSGLFLYVTALVCASMLGGVQVPRELAKRLGGRDSVQFVLIVALAIALVVFLLALVWSSLALRLPPKSRRPVNAWFYGGIGVAWLVGLVYGAINFALVPRSYQTISTLLLSSNVPPLWGVLNILAVIGASLIGGGVARRLAGRRVLRPVSRPVPA
ncbi:hypothetical protein [Pelomonas sp. KK5]|uniref:hypothetical protein n=1 Tax=Pelomonas sp. KK5 TaxID=1855730 RepID=UPI0011803D4D|nr:hypothetical protein [Pelomonas sp. KK5]